MTTKKKITSKSKITKAVSSNLKKIKAIQKETTKLRKSLKPLVVADIKAALKQYPGVKEVSWPQHTPYFADGDIPTFCCMVDDLMRIVFADERTTKSFVRFEHISLPIDLNQGYEESDLTKEGKAFVKTFNSVIKGIDDQDFKEIWGDHVVVHCSASKIWTTEDSDHG